MAFLFCPLPGFSAGIVSVRDRSDRTITVLQNHFPVNRRDRMTDSRIDMADRLNVLPRSISKYSSGFRIIGR
jgi:hypothetical protein